MLNRCDMRKEAYRYICEILGRMRVQSNTAGDSSVISLEDLSLLREGRSDPSPEMVALVKRWVGQMVGDAEIDAHLVTPFRDRPDIP